MSIYEKLNKIQVELKANKNQYNNFGKYHYRNLEDIQQATKPLLKSYKCILLLDDDIVLIGERYYVRTKATLQDVESEGKISATAFAREPMNRKGQDEAMVTMASSSYAGKGALNKLFAIDDNRDPDVTTQDEEPNIKKETMSQYLKDKGLNAKEFAGHFMIQAKQAKELLADKPKLDAMIDEYKAIVAKNENNT